MAHLTGWFGRSDEGDRALERMVAAVNAMSPVTEETVGEGFALATKQPALAGEIGRLATSPDGEVAVAFAGYLYDNDLSVANRPADHCLELYEQLGAGLAAELNGTWAVAVVDRREGKLHLIADRLASRPLYYAEGQPFLFSTRMAALLAFPGFSAQVNPARLAEFLVLANVPGTATFFDRINQVPAGSVLTWDGRESRVEHYWSPAFTYDDDATADDCGERIAAALRGAMARICARTDRAALMLSGGADSRATLAASPTQLDCVTMHVSPQAREFRVASRVARTLGHPHRFVPLPDGHPAPLMEPGAALHDGMRVYHFTQALYLAELAAETKPQTILNGWGLDGFFSGRAVPLVIRKGLSQLLPPRIQPADQIDFDRNHRPLTNTLAPWEVLAPLVRMDAAEFAEQVRDRFAEGEARLRPGARSVYDLSEIVMHPNWATVSPLGDLSAVDCISAAATPAFDSEVIDAYLATPLRYRHRHIAYSRAIARLSPAAARIPISNSGVPVTAGPTLEHWAGVAVRCWRVAARQVRRLYYHGPRLEGAWIEIGQLMATQPQWRDRLRGTARASRLVEMGVIDGDALNRTIENHLARRANFRMLIGAWLTLETWLAQQDGATPDHPAGGTAQPWPT